MIDDRLLQGLAEVAPPSAGLNDSERSRKSDVAAKDYFVRNVRGNLKYSPKLKAFFVWDGQRWKKDEDGEASRMLERIVRNLYANAADERDDAKRKGDVDFARSCESRKRLEAILALSKTDSAIVFDAALFDADAMLLNCGNGTVDLRTGQLRPHDKTDFLTRLVAFDYRPVAQCPRFDRFLGELFLDRKQLIEFVQRAAGYCATGETNEHVFFALHGAGANGKSTFVGTLQHVLGDADAGGYAATTPSSTFVDRDGAAATNDLARLVNIRLVSASELDASGRLSESFVKSVTGEDAVAVRFLYGEFFTFVPRFKLLFACNHLPRVKGNDKGIWRRIRVVPFDANFAPEARDRHLRETLAAEAEGILAWIVRGAVAWHRSGLGESPEVDLATTTYRETQDEFAAFLRERCAIEPAASVGSADLHEALTQWQNDRDEGGATPITRPAFAKLVGGHGFEKRATNKGKRWLGIRLLDAGETAINSVDGDEVTGGDYFSLNSPYRESSKDRFTQEADPSPTPSNPSPNARFDDLSVFGRPAADDNPSPEFDL